MMFKTEKQFMTIFLLQQHDLTMYIKIDWFFIFLLVMTNLSYNINCWY
jgi:hypothetical protein